jgi:simple sugar transport system ATP-binding protein
VEAILTARGITRTYGHVSALSGCDFEVYPGEITALIGDNGAGKSTLVRILSGSESADEGTITFEGHEVEFSSPSQARAMGIETVFQDLALCSHLDAVANMYLGREIPRSGFLGKFGFLNREAMRAGSAEAFAQLGASVRSLKNPVGSMSGGQKQSVAVARAAAWADKVIFLDEPTAALGVVQTAAVVDLVKRVRDRGIGVVFISHSMPEVLDVSDRVQVMRRGKRVANYKTSESSIEILVGTMTGKLDGAQS